MRKWVKNISNRNISESPIVDEGEERQSPPLFYEMDSNSAQDMLREFDLATANRN